MRWVHFFLCGCAALLAARLAYVEAIFRRDTPADVGRAIWLDRFAPPTGYFLRLGRLDEALRTNPRLSSAWIALGLEAERKLQWGQAEHDLFEAARVDHQYLPAWTLANFYFRRENGPAFWPWARRAAALSYDDARPLLQLANALDPDPLAVLNKLGGGDRLPRADLDYLIGSGRFDAAQQVARLLMARGSIDDRPRLVEMTDRQVRAGNAAYALELWSGLFPHANSKGVLNHGNFEQSPSGVGLDWRLSSPEGISTKWEPAHLTLTFSGLQAESCALVEQVVALPPPVHRYRLSFQYLATGMPDPSGVRWDLDGHESISLEASNGWREGSSVFSTFSSTRETALSRLRLVYRREPGTVRAVGRVELRQVRLEPMR